MNNSTYEKLNNNDWIDISDACKILNLTEKTVKDHCRSGKLVYKIVVNKKCKNYFIATSSILDRRKCYEEEGSFSNQKCYSDAPLWAKIQEEKYLPIIEATMMHF